MSAYLAYGAVILIWATTPLAIQWSNDSLSFIEAVTFRMLLAVSLGFVVIAISGRRFDISRDAWRLYLTASLGVFPNMPVVYWSAQFIPSGVMSVIFGLMPFFTGLMSWLLLKHNPFNTPRLLALMLALTGLALIYRDQLALEPSAGWGMLGMLASSLMFAFSSVGIKRLSVNINLLSQMTGSLLVALPGLLACWWWLDGELPSSISLRSALGVGYLALAGSMLGFTLFFYLLNVMAVSTVSLITLISPILALCLGTLVAGETLTPHLAYGAALVLLALAIYQGLAERLWRRRKAATASPTAPPSKSHSA